MEIRGSHLVSLAILAGVAGWIFTGDLIKGGQANPNAETIAEREAKLETEAFRVRVKELTPSKRIEKLSIRGRTEAEAMVSIRAETGGTVEKRLVEKGQSVKKGDLLCVIDKGVRQTQLAQMEAQLNQAKRDYEANVKLQKRGFTTKSKLRAMKTALDGAEAEVAKSRQDMKRTEIYATVSGQIHEPFAEAGDNLAPGGVCVTLVDTDPMLFSGQVPEKDIGSIQVGMEAGVSLISGETVAGNVKYISPIADAKTRTFKMEILLPNPNGKIRDGLTATAAIELQPTDAYQIESSWLVLADDGQVGLRAVSNDNRATFIPVSIVAMDEKITWVAGLEPGARIITLGQNFVTVGQQVEPVTAAQLKALQDAAAVKAKSKVKSNSDAST